MLILCLLRHCASVVSVKLPHKVRVFDSLQTKCTDFLEMVDIDANVLSVGQYQSLGKYD